MRFNQGQRIYQSVKYRRSNSSTNDDQEVGHEQANHTYVLALQTSLIGMIIIVIIIIIISRPLSNL
jgi:hypothetical protein